MIIAVDGCKGVGKTTLLEALRERLDCAVVADAKEESFRRETVALLSRFGPAITRDQELFLVDRFSQQRADLSEELERMEKEKSLVLLDRWYLTDYAFRNHVSLGEVLPANTAKGVRRPDAYIVLSCADHGLDTAVDPEEGCRQPSDYNPA